MFKYKIKFNSYIIGVKMIPLTNPDKKSIESIFDKRFDSISQKVDNISDTLSSTTSVIHRTDIQNLPNIMSEGLKIEKSVTPTGATEIIEISKRIKKELGIDKDRYKTIYATFNDKEITDSKINDLKSSNQALIEFKIDNDDSKIFVSDFEPINRAIFDQIDFNRTKDSNYLYYMKLNLYQYWESFIPLHEYINQNKEYKFPEILIFHDIKPTNLNILIK